jgi:hypothetical protein
MRSDRKFCTNTPAKGGTRCGLHGGKAAKQAGGKFSKQFARISGDYQKLIDQTLRDPDLLDARRSVAVQQVLLQQAYLVPDEELLEQLARRVAIEEAAECAPNEKIDPVTLEISKGHRAEAMHRWLKESMKMTESLARRQTDAMKQQKLGEVLTASVMPLMGELGIEFQRLVDKYVVSERREAAVNEFRVKCRHIVVRLAEFVE